MRRYQLLLVLLLTGCLSACSTPGAFFGATEGPLFKPRSLSDENRVLVYLYRPQSSWADQELEAPGLFINNQLFSGLPSGGYLVMELDTASYQLEIRRPLFGCYWTLLAESPMDFTRVASFALDVKPAPPITCATTNSARRPMMKVWRPAAMARCNWSRKKPHLASWSLAIGLNPLPALPPVVKRMSAGRNAASGAQLAMH